MKATGIVRRIDELGRVVIPKEIRRTLRIKDGDPLEIFTERDELMLKKYSPIAALEKFSEGTTRSLNDLSGYLAVLYTDSVVIYTEALEVYAQLEGTGSARSVVMRQDGSALLLAADSAHLFLP